MAGAVLANLMHLLTCGSLNAVMQGLKGSLSVGASLDLPHACFACWAHMCLPMLAVPHRTRPDHYKGMSEVEKQAILATQLAQVEERKARLAVQAAEDARHARTQADILRAMDAQVGQHGPHGGCAWQQHE